MQNDNQTQPSQEQASSEKQSTVQGDAGIVVSSGLVDTNQANQPIVSNNSKKWAIGFCILLVLNLITIGAWWVLSHTSKSYFQSNPDDFFTALGIASLGQAGILVCIANIIYSLIFVVKRKPGILKSLLCLPLILFSLWYIILGPWGYTQFNKFTTGVTPISDKDVIALINKCQVTEVDIAPGHNIIEKNGQRKNLTNNSDTQAIEKAAQNAPKDCGTIKVVDEFAAQRQPLKQQDFSVDQAIQYINACDVYTAYFGTYFTGAVGPQHGGVNADTSTTGIVAYVDSQGYVKKLYVSKKVESPVIAAAMDAKGRCTRPDMEGSFEKTAASGNLWISTD